MLLPKFVPKSTFTRCSFGINIPFSQIVLKKYIFCNMQCKKLLQISGKMHTYLVRQFRINLFCFINLDYKLCIEFNLKNIVMLPFPTQHYPGWIRPHCIISILFNVFTLYFYPLTNKYLVRQFRINLFCLINLDYKLCIEFNLKNIVLLPFPTQHYPGWIRPHCIISILFNVFTLYFYPLTFNRDKWIYFF